MQQVVKYLLRAEHLQVRAEMLKAGQHRVYIDHSSVCPRCNKKIGNSAFARFPNGVVMHYSCFNSHQNSS
jgi:hypothetical protein